MEEDPSGAFTLKIKSKSDEQEGTQKKTFTKWINSRLAKSESGQRIKDLFEDLKDGTKLLALLEVLCGKKIRRERGRMRLHYLNNVSNALRTLEECSVKLINISNDDIVDGNPKLTLALVWLIISHFQLQNPAMGNGENLEEKLLQWCKHSTAGYRGVDVKNFTTSWRDGLAFNALVHRYRPELFDYNNIYGCDPITCCEHAFTAAHDYMGVDNLLDPEDVVQARPDKKSILLYVASLFNTLVPQSPFGPIKESTEGHLTTRSERHTNGTTTTTSHTVQRTEHSQSVKRTYQSSYHTEVKHVKTTNEETEPVRFVTTTRTTMKESPVQHTASSSLLETLPAEEQLEASETSSVRDSISSFRELDDYNGSLHEVLGWLSDAERTLEVQKPIAKHVDKVKEQFHQHEDFMIELTSHQSDVGDVLGFGNQLITDGVVSEREEGEIRDQLINLNDRWEALRVAAMERQSKLHEQLMYLQQMQLDQLDDWLTSAEKKINGADVVGSDLDTVRLQVEHHKIFQEDLEKQQLEVNSLTHMVVVVDDNAADSVSADLEEQLAVLGERWSAVCRWTEQRWATLQDVLDSWQGYRDEERRLSGWLHLKEAQVEDVKHIDLGDLGDVKASLKQVVSIEQEMEAEQATFGTFNTAAERVAENLEENSPGVASIQEKMEEFNERWNRITTDVSNRIELLKVIEVKLENFNLDLEDKVQWMSDTETLLKSPNFTFDDENVSSEKMTQQNDLIESLDSARKQKKPAVAAVQRKGEELIEECRSHGNIPVTLEQMLSGFGDRWEAVGKLIEDRKHKAMLARQRREVQDLAAKVEAPLKEAERLIGKFGAELPESDNELKTQFDQCNSKYNDMVSSEVHLIKVKELSKKLTREDRHTPHIQSNVKKIDERWTVAWTTLEERKKLLSSAMEAGPPKQYLNNLDAMLLKIKNFESALGKECHYNDVTVLEEQLQKCKVLKGNVAEQQRGVDSLNSTGEKFTKSLPRQKSEQLRGKLSELNDRWRDINLLAEKRQTQLQKTINQSRQYTDEMEGLFKWIKEANDFLKDQEPAAGDSETLEAQLDQSEALQCDINKLQRKLDSLNETSVFMIGKADSPYVDHLRDEVEEVNSEWEELVRLEARVRDNLVAALEKYQKLSHDMKEMGHWILQVERSIVEDERDVDTGEITTEKMEHYKSLQQEISHRAPAVVRINTTASQLVKQTKQGSAAPLQDSIKKMNGDWARLKNKVTLRQHEFKQMQSELEQFDLTVKKQHKLMADVERVVEKSATVLEASEPEVEESLRSLNRHVSAIRGSGPGSVTDLGNKLVAKNITVAYVTEQLSEYQSRADEVHGKAEEAKRALENSLNNRRQTKKDLETVRVWLVKIEVMINTKFSKRDDVDEREIKSLEEEFTKHEALMESLEQTFREPGQSRKNSVSPKSIRELDQMRTKWKSLHGKFCEVKEQPVKKLENDFIAMHGQLLTNLDKIQRGVKKLKLESAEPRDVKNLLDRSVSFKNELESLKSDVEDVQKMGHQIMAKYPDERRAGVERRIDEVEHDYRELDKKIRKKEDIFREGLGLAERLDDDMSSLETWLEETGVEVKSREEAGFPEDVDAEIKWNKGLVQEVTGRMSDVQQLTQVGRELVDLSETGQLEALEDRLTQINNAWEELSSIAEQRLMTLPKYKAKLVEFEKSVDQMNNWLEDMEKETSTVHVDELDTALDKLGELQDGLKRKENQLQSIRKQSGEFVHKGRLIMEPYKRLVDRRWEDMSARVRELEQELERAKQRAAEAKNIPTRVETEVVVKRVKTVSKPGVFEDVIMSEERTETESELAFDEEAFMQPEFSSTQATPDETGDFKDRLDDVLSHIGDLEEILVDIEAPAKNTVDPASDKIKLAEQQLDNLQPRVELLLKEGKIMANSEGKNGATIRESLLDLSGRWLKACDEVEKKKRAIEVVPHWYQFKSNLNDISGWILKVEEDKHVEDLKPEELQQQQSKFEIVFKDIEELNRQGIQVLSPGDFERLRKRYRDINTTFEQYSKPKEEVASYRVAIHTGDVKDAGTQAHVTLFLIGEKGRSPELHPEKSETYHTKFCRDQYDTFTFNNVTHLGDLRMLQVTHDNFGVNSAWNVKGIYVEDKLTRKVYFFDCNAWVGKDKGIEKQDFACAGFTLPEEGEDIMTKHRLARVRWQLTLVEHKPVGSTEALSPAWELVDDVNRLSSNMHEVELMLVSSELQGADFDDISQQEDKLKLIGKKLESLGPKAENVFDRSESIEPKCSESELEAVKKAINKIRPEWNDLNKDFKLREERWEQAMALWKQFHCDLKDLTSWLNGVEKTLQDTKLPSGEIDVDAAKREQKGIEEGIASHQSTLAAVKDAGQEIIGKSSAVDAELLREKLKSLERRWELVTNEVSDRKDRFQEEQMQIEEFMEETADLLLWLDDVDNTLQTKDPSPADEDALEDLLDKINDLKSEYEAKEDSKNNIQQSGERLLSRSILSRPNMDTIRTRVDIVITRWEILRADFSTRIRGLEAKLHRVCQFLTGLEELSLWASETRGLLENSANSYEEQMVDPKVIQESLKSRQPTLDSINENMTQLRRESRTEGTQAPKHVEDKVKNLNEDWGGIASSTANLFAARIRKPQKVEEVITAVTQMSVQHAALDDLLDWEEEGGERASPWPKFDKAVAELHEWLDTVDGMTKTDKIVLGDTDDMEGLVEKQKSVDDQLQGKQHLLDEIAEMGHTLTEDADKEEDKFLIDDKVSRLKEHWQGVAEKSSVWKGQIDFMMDEWRRYVELREELLQWTRKAEASLEREENLYGYTVNELEEQIEKHKEFEEEIEKWRSNIAAINQCGDSLVQEFSQYESTEMKHNLTELNERWNTIVNRSTTRRKHLQEVFERMVRFHEDMINALTWLTSAESKVAELDSAVDSTNAEQENNMKALKTELTHLEEDINTHQEMFASLNENGSVIMAEMESGDVLTAVQSKLDDMNDRWQSLNVRSLDVRDRLEETATEWRQLLMDLQEMIDWIARAEQELSSQQPIGGDLEIVQRKNENHQAFKGKLNVRRLVVDRALESSRRLINEYEDEKTAEEAKGTSRTRIAQNLDRQIETVNKRWSTLCKASEEWQKRIDDVLRRLQILRGQMDDIDLRLTEAEQIRATWTPTQDLIIESLSDQLEELKNLQERIASLQGMFEGMSSAEGELRRVGVSLSSGLENRIDQLNRRWKQLQLQLLQRQHMLQEAYSDFDSPVLQRLQASVESPWERAVSLNKVPYYINHKTESTQWDHPKMTELYHQIAELNDIKYSAYRTAMKLRCLQKATCLDMVTLTNVMSAFEQHNLSRAKHEELVGVTEMVNVLNAIYDNIDAPSDYNSANSAICIDLTLNWLLNVYDSGRVGKIRLLSFKIGLVALSRSHLEDKYKYLFLLVVGENGFMDHKQLGLLLHDTLQIPRQLGEIAAFGGSNIEPSVRSCFQKNRSKQTIESPQFLVWLSAEPQSIVWLPTLHRLAASEAVKHKAKCSICKEYPIVGFRFRCLKCFNYDLCQSCFWSGRVSHDHRLTHPMHQYCLSTTSGEDVQDFLSMVRNKFKKRRYKNKPPRKLGYLPIQTVMEGGNLETPPVPTPQQNVNNEVHNRLGMYAHRLAEAETNGGKFNPTDLDEEHMLIAQYCQSLKSESIDAPQSPTQIVMALDSVEKDDLENDLLKLEEENRELQEEYERLKGLRDQDRIFPEGEVTPGGTPQNRDSELLAEAKLLRQHKGRLEARMQVLEDHNRQLEAQLQRLRQLLDQPNQDKLNTGQSSGRTSPSSSISSLGADSPFISTKSPRQTRPRGADSDTESEASGHEPLKNGVLGKDNDDPALKEVMNQINSSFPPDKRNAQDPVGNLFSTAQDVNKAVESLVQVMTDDERS